MLVLKASTLKDAYSQAFKIVSFDPGILTGGGVTSMGDWQAYGKQDAEGIAYGLAGQIVGENAYIVVVKADKPGVGVENGPVMRALASVKIAGKKAVGDRKLCRPGGHAAAAGGPPGRQRLGCGGRQR